MRRSPGAISCSARTSSACSVVSARCRVVFRSRRRRRSLPVARATPPASDEALGAVAGLIDKSLLLRAETSVATRPLYQMLETVRAYAALELTAAGERDDAMEGLARYCAARSRARGGGAGRTGAGRMAGSRARRSRELPRRADVAHRARPSRRSVRHRVGADVLLADPRPCGRRPPVVRTDSGPAVASAGGRVESARRRGADVVHAGRARTARTALDARAGARPRRRRHGDGRAGSRTCSGTSNIAAGNLDAARDRFTRSVDGFQALAIPWGTGNALSGMAAGRPGDRRRRPGGTPAR